MKLLNMMDRVLLAVLALGLATLLAIMGAQIIARYIMNASLIWAEETCRYLLIWISFLGLSPAYARGEVAAVEFLADAMPTRIATLLSILTRAMVLGLCVLLVRYGLIFADRIGQQPIPALRFLLTDLLGPGAPLIPMFWVYMALPVGLLFFILRIAVELGLLADMLRRGGSPADLRRKDLVGDMS